MPSFVFRGDDITIGPDFAIIAIQSRRLLIRNLGRGDLKSLKVVRRFRAFPPNFLSKNLTDRLEQSGCIGMGYIPRIRFARIPAFLTEKLILPFIPFAGRLGLLVILAAAIWSWCTYFGLLSGIISNTHISGLFLSLIAGKLSSGFIHELGHGAASKQIGKAVGPIRFTRKFPLPGYAIDVSVISLCKRAGRVHIILAGPIFQLGFSGLLLCIAGSMSDGYYFAVAALPAMTAGIGSLLPLSGHDGGRIVEEFTHSTNSSATF